MKECNKVTAGMVTLFLLDSNPIRSQVINMRLMYCVMVESQT